MTDLRPPADARDPLAETFGAARVAEDERRALVRSTFEAVAPRYDLMNDPDEPRHPSGLGSAASCAPRRLGRANGCSISPGEPAAVAFLGLAAGAHVTVADPGRAMMAVGARRPRGAEIEWVAARRNCRSPMRASIW